MWRFIRRLICRVLLVVAATGTVFVVGMRRKWPAVLNPVRKLGRASRPFALKKSGSPGAKASVIRHIGRISGRAHETPVDAVGTDDGFVIALPYGPNTDWLKNVLASGSATIVHDGATHPVDRPGVVPTSVAAPLFSASDQRTHRLFGVAECLLVRRVEQDHAADPA